MDELKDTNLVPAAQGETQEPVTHVIVYKDGTWMPTSSKRVWEYADDPNFLSCIEIAQALKGVPKAGAK